MAKKKPKKDVDKLAKLQSILKRIKEIRSHNRLLVEYKAPLSAGNIGGPYDYQVEFHNAGAKSIERAALWANRSGKSQTGAVEGAYHATGLYPDWWEGRRFEKPARGLVAGESNESTRNICQFQLLGGIDENRRPMGSGWIPADLIGKIAFRQSNVGEVIEQAQIKHKSGEWSTINFKSYEQGWSKFQGEEYEWIWFDEEPTDPRVYHEGRARIITTDGIMWLTRTPLFGATAIIQKFLDEVPGTWMSVVGWDICPHMTEARQEAALAAFPEHERACRKNGTPLLGSGGVYIVPDEMILVEPFEIPVHLRRICGLDFGIAHPAASAWLAYDADADIVYLYHCYKKAGETPAYHVQATLVGGKWIPVAWPHDGMVRDKGSGKMLADQYRDRGLDEMLPRSARYTEDTGGAQSRERITQEILERMSTSRFKVFNTPNCQEYLKEKRMLHRDEKGQIVPINDDIESAVRIAMIDLRCARSSVEVGRTLPTKTADDYDPLAEYARV